MKLRIWPPPRDVYADCFWVIGWLMHRAACFLGSHEWVFDERIRVPYYGTGHDQCVMCGVIRVNPCR